VTAILTKFINFITDFCIQIIVYIRKKKLKIKELNDNFINYVGLKVQ